MGEVKTAYVVLTNSDLTEGRGYQYPLAVCEIKATAKRLGSGRYVQGSDCPIEPVELVNLEGKWYFPSNSVALVPPSPEDILKQQEDDKTADVVRKAKTLGLTDDELKILMAVR